MRRILDKSFRYTPAAQTDIARTFKRIRAEQKAQAEREAQNAKEVAKKMTPLKVRTA